MAILKTLIVKGVARFLTDAYMSTIKSGIWNGSTIQVGYGGTGVTSAVGDLYTPVFLSSSGIAPCTVAIPHNTKDFVVNGITYPIFTTYTGTVPPIFAPSALAGTGGYILATNSGKTGLEWVAANAHTHALYVLYDPGTTEQTIKNSISSMSKGVINLYRNNGDYYTFLGFSNGTTETYLGGIGFKALNDPQPYLKHKNGSYFMIANASNISNDNITVPSNTETTIATIAGVPIKINVLVANNISTTAVLSSSNSGTTHITAALANPYYNLVEGSSVARSIRFMAGSGMTIVAATNGTVTFTTSGVPVAQETSLNNLYPLVWSSENNENTVTSDLLKKSYNFLYWNPAARAFGHGAGVVASGGFSHAEGINSTASNQYAHAEGSSTVASGDTSHAEGYLSTASGALSHAEGYNATASGYASHAEGINTVASNGYAHAEGSATVASGDTSHAEGYNTRAQGLLSHAEGINSVASNLYAHAEGSATTASGDTAHSEGYNTVAYGTLSHAEGVSTRTEGYASHAEGNNNRTVGDYAHAEGQETTATGWYSHSEGFQTNARGKQSHAEGRGTQSIGEGSHAQGYNTLASGNYSFTAGYETRATKEYEAAFGKYNNSGTYTLFSVGNGSSNTRLNAFEVSASGNFAIAGGFVKHNSSDSYVLLGGGGHKALSTIIAESDARYVRLNAGAAEQTIQNSIANISNGSIEIWRATSGGYPMIGFATGTTKTKLGLLGFGATANIPIFRSTTGTDHVLAHSGNIINNSATIGTSQTTIATIAGVDITANIGSYSPSDHTHTVKINGVTKTIAAPGGTAVDLGNYVRLSDTEQTIESTISSYLKGIIEFYRSSGNHIAFIQFANKDDNGNKQVLGAIGFHSGTPGRLEFKDVNDNYYLIAHAGNITQSATPVVLSNWNTEYTIATIAGKDIKVKTTVDPRSWRDIYTAGTSRVGTGIDTKAINFAASGNLSITYLAAGTGTGQSGNANYFTVRVDAAANAVGTAGYVAAPTKASNPHNVWMTNADGVPAWRTVSVPATVPTIGTSATTIATIGGVTIQANIGSYAPASHTHYYLVTSGDNRSVVTTPGDYANKFTFVGLKSNSTLGISDAGSYSYLIGLRGWGDHSGGGSHELAFTQSLGLLRRQASTADTWGSWIRMADSSNTSASVDNNTLTLNICGTTTTYTPQLSTFVLQVFNGNVTTKSSTWADVVAVNDREPGTYAILISSSTNKMFASGVFSLCNDTDATNDEIPLHVSSTSNGWRPYAKINGNQLQMSSTDAADTTRSYTIKIFKLI